jgi:hypothetical protein
MPTARQFELLVEKVRDGLVVYDTRSHSAHSLPSAVAAVWELCDGRRSGPEIASELRLDPEFVERALAELAGADLLDGPETPGVDGLTRRRILVRGARVAAASVAAAPLIETLLVPTSDAAASGGAVTAVGTFTCVAVAENPYNLDYSISPTTAHPTGSSGTVEYNDTFFFFDTDGNVANGALGGSTTPTWIVEYGTTQASGFTTDGLSIYTRATSGNYQFSGSAGGSSSGSLTAGGSQGFNLVGGESITLTLSFT